MIRRFFIAFAVGFVCMFGTTVSYACTSDEIDVMGDGSQCEAAKFTITTTEIADGETFQFYMSAKGTFYVDCGTGGTLSGTGASGKTITRSNTTGATYTCTYTGDTEAKTIRFGGIAATGNAYSTGVNISAAAIRFNVTPALVASISGSLGAVFPSRGTTTARQPVFWSTFANCTKLTEIPSGLFSGVTGARTYMYSQTFWGCTGLEEIPAGLFSGNSGAASSMFWGTFNNCSGLRIIPQNLFGNISGKADYLFQQTFASCTSLEQIPAELFSGISGAAQSMFWQTFSNCSGLKSIPSGLFSGISGTATNMFSHTFYNCSGLTGYIPAGMFDKITTYSNNMMNNMFYGTGFDTTCSGTTVQYITGFESYWNGKVSCTEPFVTPVVLDGQSATTTSVPTTVYLKYGAGWYSDAGATTSISVLTTNPTKTDYDFDGYWTATNGAGTQVIDNDGNFLTTDAILKMAKMADTSKTIYANWTTDYTVTYDCGDGTGTPPAGVTATSGKDFTPALSTGCYKDGYILSGWLVSNTTNNEIKTTGGTFVWNYNESKTFVAQYVESKFEVQTINLGADDTVSFNMGARGTFYVDWGDGMTYKLSCYELYVSCGGTSGSYSGNAARTACKVINTNEVYENTMPHTYSKPGEYVVRFGGVATSYRDQTPCYSSTSFPGAAIRFNNWVKRILPGGKLSELFPHFGTGLTRAVRFEGSFSGCSNLLSIPEDLFRGYTFPNTRMFQSTFSGCSGLTGSIPENLFSDISGAPASSMFFATFNGCSGLTGSIPEDLFAGISGAPAQALFQGTFMNCSGLSGSIPENLFAGISGAPAQSMFNSTFSGCSGLTGSIPENLFSGISGAPASSMFSSTFKGCSGLTGSIPEDLFAGISGAPAQYMFYSTFARCSGLTGSIPSGLFRSLSGAGAQYMFGETFAGCTGLTGYVPKGLFENITSTGSGGVGGTFTNTNLYTECPCGAKPAETGWGDTTVDSRAVCEVGLKDGEFFYNGVCTTNCQSGGTKLMLGNGSEFPILSTKVTNPALNVKFRYNSSICYVPLESGNGGSGSLNVSYGGQTYHAGTLPVEPD